MHTAHRLGQHLLRLGLIALMLLVTSLAPFPGSVQPAYAAAGDLDLTFAGFGTSGKVLTDYNNGLANDVAIQPDGKIVVAGRATISGSFDFVVARYNRGGSLDATFGSGGFASADFAQPAGGNAIAIQPDGKSVVAGFVQMSASSDFDFAVARFTATGSLDTTFDGDGKLNTSFGGYEYATAIALQSDGKIVVAGTCCGGDFALARYNTDGTLDTGFDGDGKRAVGPGDGDEAYAVAIQPDGKIVVAGLSRYCCTIAFALARLNPNGTLDNSFGGDGTVTTNWGGGEDSGYAIALQPDGKIVVCGDNASDFLVARYNTDGSLDSTFGGDGSVLTHMSGVEDSCRGLILQPDGKIVAAGGEYPGSDFGLVRYNPDGGLDTTFSGDGQLTTDFGGAFDFAYGLAQQADGRLVAVGELGQSVTGTTHQFALARYFLDGTLDDGGRDVADFANGDDVANAAVFQSDGKLVLAGRTAHGSSGDFALLRYTTAGRPDSTFGSEGQVTYGFGGDEGAFALALQTDGKIVAAGYSTASNVDFMFARFKPDGTPDGSLNLFGLQTTDFGSGDDIARAVALQPDGKIVLAGYASNGSDFDFAVARYAGSNGALDTTFGADGKVTTHLGTGYEVATSIAIQPDGKIVVAGGYAGDFVLVRYTPDGGLDTSFDGDGKVFTNIGGNEVIEAITLQPDGKIVAAGYTSLSGGNFVLARYNPDGSLDDRGFGVFGLTETDFGGDDIAYAVALQGSTIVAAGCAHTGSVSRFYLARYNTLGILDTTFNGNGKTATSFSLGDCARGVAVAPGRIAAAGSASDGGHSDFAVAVYQSGVVPPFSSLSSLYLPLIMK